MTKFQQIIAAAIIAMTGLFAANQFRLRRAAQAEAATLHAQQANLTNQVAQLEESVAAKEKQIADLLAENSRLQNNPYKSELLKLRSEVTRLLPLQNDVVALQRLLKQSSHGLAQWKTNELADAGRVDPLSAFQSFVYFSQQTNLATLRTGIVGDDVDPPSPEEMEKFLTNNANFPGADSVSGYKVVSQNWLSPDKVQLQVIASMGETDFGIAIPFTLHNVGGEWKITVFNVRDQNGKISELNFFGTKPNL